MILLWSPFFVPFLSSFPLTLHAGASFSQQKLSYTTSTATTSDHKWRRSSGGRCQPLNESDPPNRYISFSPISIISCAERQGRDGQTGAERWLFLPVCTMRERYETERGNGETGSTIVSTTGRKRKTDRQERRSRLPHNSSSRKSFSSSLPHCQSAKNRRDRRGKQGGNAKHTDTQTETESRIRERHTINKTWQNMTHSGVG